MEKTLTIKKTLRLEWNVCPDGYRTELREGGPGQLEHALRSYSLENRTPFDEELTPYEIWCHRKSDPARRHVPSASKRPTGKLRTQFRQDEFNLSPTPKCRQL